MRVASGLAKGVKLHSPLSSRTRPTTQKVKEAVFDSLRTNFSLQNTKVVDLFAGSGAMGIEALSQGASQVTFVENNLQAIKIIEANIVSTKLDRDKTTLVRANVLTWLSRCSFDFDLAFCDPPYEFSNWIQVFDLLKTKILVVESNKLLEVSNCPYDLYKVKKYGDTVISFLIAQSS